MNASIAAASIALLGFPATVAAAPAPPVVVPFTLVGGHIFVDARIDGHGPYRMVVDTGASDAVSTPVATALHLRTSGDFDVYGAGEHAAKARSGRVGDIEIGGATLHAGDVLVLGFDELRDVEGVAHFDGLIGHELFDRYVVRLDYSARTLTLYDPASYVADGNGVVVPLQFYGGIPEVEGSVDGIPGRFTLDTGDRGSLSLTAPFVAAHDLIAHYHSHVEGIAGWGIGGPFRAYITRADRLRLGAVWVDAPVTKLAESQHGFFTSSRLAGNVGAGVFARYTVTFNYAKRQVTFDAAQPAQPDIYDRSGMWLVQKGDAFVVADVVAGGPAEQAGVDLGDRIVAVDGRPSRELELAAVRQTLRGAPGTPVALSIVRAGAPRDVTVALRELV